MHTRRTIAFAFLLLGCVVAVASACQIPVFRYALEKWEPDAYVLFIAHRGELNAADKALVEQLQQTLRERNNSLNLIVSLVDVAQEQQDPVLQALLDEKLKTIDTPLMVLAYPFNHALSPAVFDAAQSLRDLDQASGIARQSSAPPGQTPALPGQTTTGQTATGRTVVGADEVATLPGFTAAPLGLTPAPAGLSALCPTGTCNAPLGPPRLAWSGKLSAENIQQVIDSPIRNQIAKRLLDGQSAVWVFLESSDAAKNAAALANLEGSLAEMQRTLKLADKKDIESDEFYEPDTTVDLRIQFSVLRVAYQTAGEDTVFISTLFHADPEVAGQSQPIAIPVFGRGRSYFALAGKGINAKSIEQQCRFLIGDCSCRVKHDNPGIDLLFSVDWDDSIRGSSLTEKPLPELTGIGLTGAGQGFPGESYERAPAQQPVAMVKATVTDGTPKKTGVASEEPLSIAQQTVSTANQASQHTAPATDEPTPLSATTLNWIFGLAALTLLFILAGMMWLRIGAQS